MEINEQQLFEVEKINDEKKKKFNYCFEILVQLTPNYQITQLRSQLEFFKEKGIDLRSTLVGKVILA